MEEISVATKISVRFLKSIENEDFSKLPGGLFNRSFIRAYAHYLGLEEESLLAEYQLAAKAKGEVDLARLSFPASRTVRTRGSRSTWVGVGAAVVLLLAGYGLWRYSRGSATSTAQTSRQDSAQKKSPSPAVVTASPQAASTKPATASSQNPKATVSSTPTKKSPTVPTAAAAATVGQAVAPTQQEPNPAYANSLVLQVTATESSWIAVDADGKTVMQGLIGPNESKTFKAKEYIDFMTGNARGVVLNLNGRTLKPLGREGEVKSVHLTWDDVKNHRSP